MRQDTVQIVGAAPSIAVDPVIDGAERWLFNASYRTDQGRPYTRVFNLETLETIQRVQPYAWAWYAAQDRPVYLQEAHPDIPHSLTFPLSDVQQYFANDHEPEQCFGCTLDYLIAFALLQGFAHIDLMGIECRSHEEYRDQRATVMYWMGRGRGMGRRVTCSASSGLCMVPAIYGYNRQTGAPVPPGDPLERWAHGHPHSTIQ